MGQKKRRMEWSRTLRGLCPRKRKRRKRRERRNSPGFLMETSRLSAGRMGNITYSPLLIFMSINYIIIVHKEDHSFFKTNTYWKEIHTEVLNSCSPGCFCLLLHLFTAQSSDFFIGLEKTVVWQQRFTKICRRPVSHGQYPTQRWWWREDGSRNWRNACRSLWAAMGGLTRVNHIIQFYSVYSLMSFWEKTKTLAHLGEYTFQM